jgi:hypothetical protein
MAETWDMSFLVDQSTQIQEARGNLGRHFGILHQVLIGKHLVNFVGAEDRLSFLRMMGRLSQRTWQGTVAMRFRTPLSGEKRVALQTRPGSGPAAWWLMIGETDAEHVPLISEVGAGDPIASAEEFGAVAAAASVDAPSGLDLSVFRAAALAEDAPGKALSDAKHAELDLKIGDTLRENATGGIVTQPGRGEYALVHARAMPAERIAEHVGVTADTAGMPTQQLGLSHQSTPLPDDARAADIHHLIHNLRLDLAGRATGLARNGTGYRGGASGAEADRKPSFFANLIGLIK